MAQVTYECHLNNLDFQSLVNRIVAENDIEDIVETGTNLGTGSTMVMANTGLDVNTIECNPGFHAQAISNLKHMSNVTCHLGLSLKKQVMMEYLKHDKNVHPSDILIDSMDPLSFYTKEIDFPVPDDLLVPLVSNNRRQLIFLDSAGGVGFAEFLSIMMLPGIYKIFKVILLDDCMHVKHYRSVKFLEENGYTVNKILNGRVCWAKL
jgi:hypothetical protein